MFNIVKLFPFLIVSVAYFCSHLAFAEIDTEKTYRIVNTSNNLYLNASSQQTWSDILMAPLNPGWSSQKWQLEKVYKNTYRIKNTWNNYYLNAISQSEWDAVVSAPIILEKQSMLWNIITLENGKNRLQNVWSGHYLKANKAPWQSLTQSALRKESGSQLFDLVMVEPKATYINSIISTDAPTSLFKQQATPIIINFDYSANKTSLIKVSLYNGNWDYITGNEGMVSPGKSSGRIEVLPKARLPESTAYWLIQMLSLNDNSIIDEKVVRINIDSSEPKIFANENEKVSM